VLISVLRRSTYILLLGAAAGALSTLLLYNPHIPQVGGAAQAATVDEHAKSMSCCMSAL